jgi:WD40 repeat protein
MLEVTLGYRAERHHHAVTAMAWVPASGASTSTDSSPVVGDTLPQAAPSHVLFTASRDSTLRSWTVASLLVRVVCFILPRIANPGITHHSLILSGTHSPRTQVLELLVNHPSSRNTLLHFLPMSARPSQLSSPPRARAALHGHSGWVTDLVYLGAQHHRLASCSLDKRVKLWTPDDGRCIVVRAVDEAWLPIKQ